MWPELGFSSGRPRRGHPLGDLRLNPGKEHPDRTNNDQADNCDECLTNRALASLACGAKELHIGLGIEGLGWIKPHADQRLRDSLLCGLARNALE